MLLPFSAGDLLDDMHRLGTVTDVQYCEEGCRASALVPPAIAGRLEAYLTAESAAAAAARRAAEGISGSGDDSGPATTVLDGWAGWDDAVDEGASIDVFPRGGDVMF